MGRRFWFFAALFLAPVAFASGEDGARPSDASGAGPGEGRIQEESGPTPGPEDHAARRALMRGLEYLAKRQRETGTGAFPPDPRQRERATIGVTALSALAFLASGSSPGRGPFGKEARLAIDYLIEKCDLAPASPTFGYISTGNDVSRTHGHGFATLALAEAYGMSPGRPRRLATALAAAVHRIEVSQGTEGGWEYEPRAVASHEGSVTIALVQALRAARNAGIEVDPKVIARAEDYVVRLQKPDGTFRYKLDSEDSTLGLTAAGITTLNMAGRYDDAILNAALDAITTGLARERDLGTTESRFPYYRRLYLAQAFWQLDDTSIFRDWFHDERARILGTQERDGSWHSSAYGDCYATAINCLVLAIPGGLLPIFQR
ncbi:MAG TPA: hypothetical protein ENJ09_03775 [Planctomycetes bacterium]|nr:hypothetical protein [Planctomycetota bacterium]